jgi:ABC-type uncharacterized transport system substrate-binding protein
MPETIRKLMLGLVLIAAASAALVGSDLAQRHGAGKEQAAPTAGGPDPARLRSLAWVTYSLTPPVEECQTGMRDELAKLGWVEGTTIRTLVRDAQLDVGTLNTMAAAIADQPPEIVCTFTTVALQAVMRRNERTPIVFSLVADPVLAGAGTSDTDHRANVTGISTRADFERMAEVIAQVMPRAKVIGTIYCPGEINSVFSRGEFEKALAARGVRLEAAAADRATDYSQAGDTLVARRVDLIVQIPDAMSSTAFPALGRIAERTRTPLFSFTTAHLRAGAMLTVARDFEQLGRQAAHQIDRVLRGADPAGMPFEEPTRTIVATNPDKARLYGVEIPPALAAKVDLTVRDAPDAPAAPPGQAPAATPPAAKEPAK